MTGSSSSGTARPGPWTLRCCVTAACTRCGAVPLDEDTGLTPHFDSTGQAREELPRDWGWHLTTRTGFADDELLCPPCAPAGGGGQPGQPASSSGNELAGTDSGQRPGAVPWWLETVHDPDRELPANPRVFPPATRRKEAEPGGEADGSVPD